MRTRAVFVLVLAAGCVEYDIIQFDAADHFRQDPPAEVDVLVVVDNSYSMQPYQEKLATNFDQFVAFFDEASVDYHIAVTTTTTIDSDHGELNGCTAEEVDAIPEPGGLVQGAFIHPETNKPNKLFEDLVQVGVCGTGLEMGMEAAWLAIDSEAEANQAWRRTEASLSILFVSDEEDVSPLPPRDYVDKIRVQVAALEDRQRFNASALVFGGDIGDCTTEQAADASEGLRYVAAVSATGGVRGDICSANYGSALTEMSIATARLTEAFFLSEEPAEDTIEVEVDGLILPCDSGQWSYQRLVNHGVDTPAIVFPRTDLPPPGAAIAVRYLRGNGEASGVCPDDAASEVQP